ncbi:GPI-ANCHORED ADHESIN-LIKE PROTEIN [Salix koriyanagi]|uniref:GPI-ANCHORED ADHESIN-LIKE PROTEIN n=1 Tax=Salix koriyanagi TaxID=2511006 RepID=A0A9Q0T4K5_9ROSI|nr:GPI-ANCHORED ADHESIN-LIKE PROTEIN [Salix koriyanagi]
MLLCQRRPDLTNPWKPSLKDQVVRSSWGSDMSIDDPTEDESDSYLTRPHPNPFQNKHQQQQASQELQQIETTQTQLHLNQSKSSTCQQPNSSLTTQKQTLQNENKEEDKKKEEAVTDSSTSLPSQPSRRLSVQDRINLFENKQKESSGGKPGAAVLRRWSGASDMSIDLGNDKKDDNNIDSPLCTPSSSSVSGTKSNVFPVSSDDDKDQKGRVANSWWWAYEEGQGGEFEGESEFERSTRSLAQLRSSAGKRGTVGAKAQLSFQENSRGFPDKVETVAVKNQVDLQTEIGSFVGRVGNVASGNRTDVIKLRDQSMSQSRSGSSQTHTRSFQDSLKQRLFKGEVDQARKEDTELKTEDNLEVSRMRVQKQPF